MAHRLARIMSAICIVAGTIMAAPTPAAATVSGEVIFECGAHFYAYPSSSGSGYCSSGIIPPIADIPAIAKVTAAGTAKDEQPYLVDGFGPVYFAFDHSEGCIADEPPVLWTMYGTLTVTDVPALHNGQATTANVQIPFSATVIGTHITFVTSGTTISFGDGWTATGGSGAGSGVFFPRLGQDNRCPHGGPMPALIQGEIDLPI